MSPHDHRLAQGDRHNLNRNAIEELARAYVVDRTFFSPERHYTNLTTPHHHRPPQHRVAVKVYSLRSPYNTLKSDLISADHYNSLHFYAILIRGGL